MGLLPPNNGESMKKKMENEMDTGTTCRPGVVIPGR